MFTKELVLVVLDLDKNEDESGESNRVCGENEESSERSWGGIEESTGRNEVVSGQEKKESRKLEEREQSDGYKSWW